MEKWSKISELQMKFGNPENIKIYDRKRTYKGEAKVRLITADLLATGMQEEMVTMYMLSDMILIGGTQEGRQILLKYLYLDNNSFIGDIEDGKIL